MTGVALIFWIGSPHRRATHLERATPDGYKSQTRWSSVFQARNRYLEMWHRSVVVCEKHSIALAVVEWSRRGLPCVLLHGFGDAACVWNHLATRIMPEFRAVAIDLRGHGDSDWDPETRYDLETLTADLGKVVALFGFERMVLIGHSFGAAVAMRFAAENAARAAGLVIVDFGPELDEAGVNEVLRAFADMPRTFASTDDYADWLIAHRPLADPNQLRHLARCSLRQSSQGWQPKADAALATNSEISRTRGEGRPLSSSRAMARFGADQMPKSRHPRYGIWCPALGCRHTYGRSQALRRQACDYNRGWACRHDGQSKRVHQQRHWLFVWYRRVTIDRTKGYLGLGISGTMDAEIGGV